MVMGVVEIRVNSENLTELDIKPHLLPSLTHGSLSNRLLPLNMTARDTPATRPPTS
jgi:hypothetical protein